MDTDQNGLISKTVAALFQIIVSRKHIYYRKLSGYKSISFEFYFIFVKCMMAYNQTDIY